MKYEFPERWGGVSDELQDWADHQVSILYSEAERLLNTMTDVGIPLKQAMLVLPRGMKVG